MNENYSKKMKKKTARNELRCYHLTSTLCLSNFLCDYCSFFFALDKFSKTFRILCMSLAVLPTKEVDSDSL